MKKLIFQILTLIFIATLYLGCKTISLNTSQSQSKTQNEEYLRFQIDSLKLELSKLNYSFEPGKVYTRCAMDPVFETVKSKDKYCIYTGKNKQQEEISEINILTKPAFTKWVKKKSSEICILYGKLDNQACENWHLKDFPPRYKNIYIVNDTSKIKEFKTTSIDIERIVKKSYLSEFRENVCPTICPSNLVGKIQFSLREKGYSLQGAKDNLMDDITKNAIMEFQKKNGLPVGNLNFETLKSMGIE